MRTHVLPSLGDILVTKLTARGLQDWHWHLAEQPRRVRTRRGNPAKFKPLDVTDPEIIRRRRATANRTLTYLKAALNHAWREGLVPADDAWRRVKPFRAVDAPVIRYLTEPEITRLLNTCQGSFRDLVHGALLTGCRYGELCRLRVEDYDRETRSLVVRIAKGGKARHVALTDEGLELIERLVAGGHPEGRLFQRDDGKEWKASQAGRPMREACARVGILKASFHILRHTHASHLAMQGVPMGVIAKQLGHADTRMTERHYAHVAPSYVADMIRRSFPRLSPMQTPVVVPLRAAPGAQ
jgi:integrase